MVNREVKQRDGKSMFAPKNTFTLLEDSKIPCVLVLLLAATAKQSSDLSFEATKTKAF